MKNIKVVIGANFGDEGKGLITDYLAYHANNGIVVRFNGGAQAGHTVTSPDGERHVFGHFCSGAFAGLPGYLSEFFVVNPMLFLKELEQLERIGNTPIPDADPVHEQAPSDNLRRCVNTRLYVDKGCMVTTPYDMMINQIAELSRGIKKHGSCGVGFNETITRCLYDEAYKLCVNDLKDENMIRLKLAAIRNKYISIRLKQLGVTAIPKTYTDLLSNDGIIERFAADAANMLRHVEITDLSVLDGFDDIIFEGAQGLLLDQSHEYFPHVTRSNTGIKNAAELIKKAGCRDAEIIYVTRAYMTRHGAGPFPTELPEKPYTGIVDMTNVPNPYQDVLRYGLMDIETLNNTVKRDLTNAEGVDCDVKLAVTCLDQLNEEVDFVIGQEQRIASVNEFIKLVFEKLQIKHGYLSNGPTREAIKLSHWS